ncbi:MAG: hypothetical protein WBD55_07205 [Dehalococcoidia bacterium]
MPKQRPSRSTRRRQVRRPPPPPRANTAPRPAPNVAAEDATNESPASVAAPSRPTRTREPSIARKSARDYSYIGREFRRILLLAAVIIITIIVLSFFIP